MSTAGEGKVSCKYGHHKVCVPCGLRGGSGRPRGRGGGGGVGEARGRGGRERGERVSVQ